MKTITIILATVFILQINYLFASNDNTPVNPTTENNYNSNIRLAPATPKDAEFSDDDLSLTEIIISLAPITPAVADFDEVPGNVN